MYNILVSSNQKPDIYVFESLSQLILKCKQYNQITWLINEILKFNVKPTNKTFGTLLLSVAQIGDIENAIKLFELVKTKKWDLKLNVIDCSQLIQSLKNAKSEYILDLLNYMDQQRIILDEVTYLCLLKICNDPSKISLGKMIHQMIIKSNKVNPTINLETSLLSMYSKCECLEESRQIFDKMRKQENKDVITWNAMIAGYAQFGSA
jgi:pentatricopeptide repeat protein